MVVKLSDLIRNGEPVPRRPSPSAVEHSARREVIRGSDHSVQELSALYDRTVDALDGVLNAVIGGNRAPEMQGAWAAAQHLIPGIRANARILFGFVSRAYAEKTIAHHSVNVLIVALKAAESLSLSAEENLAMGQAALFHDIGMGMVPQAILDKSHGLSSGEEEQVRKHTDYGAEILQKDGNELACLLVRQSHEREDGKGYPRGLKGAEIHPLAKLLHATIAFEAVVHPHSHKPLFSPVEAMKNLKNGVGTHFGGEAFRVLLKTVGAFPVGSLVELNTRERAKVIGVRSEHLLRPIVAVLTDTKGNYLPESRFLDLAENNSMFIERSVVDAQLQEMAVDVF